MSKPAARERLTEAALTLFDENGYEQTTVDDITGRAGLSRATFFRHYRSKEDVIFPDHDRLLEQVRKRLLSSSHATALVAVSDAVRLVLLHYLEEGDLARRRYALTSTVPALRDREIVSVARYQRLFRTFITDWMGDQSESAALRAELMAASVVSAHNHVLRRWLRGESPDPVREVDEALRQVIELFTTPATPPAHDGTTIAVFRSGEAVDALIPALRRLLEDGLSIGLAGIRRKRRRAAGSDARVRDEDLVDPGPDFLGMGQDPGVDTRWPGRLTGPGHPVERVEVADVHPGQVRAGRVRRQAAQAADQVQGVHPGFRQVAVQRAGEVAGARPVEPAAAGQDA